LVYLIAVNVVGMFLQGNFGVDFTGHLGGQAIGFTMHQSGHLK
jgi:membrane associated rhomboid family serine protease